MYTPRFALVSVTLIAMLLAGVANAQTMDYNLNQAIRAIDSIGSGLQRLQPNDVSGLKRLHKKLDKASTLLQTSESTSHPDYQSTVQKLADLQQQLGQFATAQPLNQPDSNTSAAKQSDTAQTAKQPASTDSKSQERAAEQVNKADAGPSQTMDYNLSQAIREIDSITSGLERLRENDFNGFNRLSTKLNKAAELLQTSESRGHPDFQVAAQRWTALQQQMAQIAITLQQSQNQQQKLLAEQQAKQAAEAEQKRQARAAEKAHAAEQMQLQAQTAAEVLNPMVANYNRASLPVLADHPTPEVARTWATAMHQLQTTQLQADLAKIDSLLASGAASKEDARQARFWISDSSQRQIKESIRNARQVEDGAIASLQYQVELINSVDPADMNQAYRFAGEEKYERNKQHFTNAIRAGAVVDVFNSIFGAADNDRTQLLSQITAARQKLDVMKPVADEQAKVLANAEPAVRPKNKDFLAPVAQEYWLDGNLFAESDSNGGIWIDGNQVGTITHNGEIWIGGNDMGSIEPNGDVWFDAYQVGSLEPNGEVWRDSNHIGLIDQEGTVWVNSNPSGEIEPFQGEWKRAAIVYYFRYFFAQ